MKKTNKGFTVIEVMAAMAIIAVTLSGLVAFAAGISRYRELADARSADSAERFFRQQQVVSGVLPGSVWDTALNGATAIAVANFTQMEAVVAAAGDSSGTSAIQTRSVVYDVRSPLAHSPVVGAATAYFLTAPHEAAGDFYSGKPKAPTFTLPTGAYPNTDPNISFHLVIRPSENPPGTIYFYTFGGNNPPNPTDSSPVWTDRMFSGVDFPHIIKVVAYNPQFETPFSDVATLTLNYGLSGIGLIPEDYRFDLIRLSGNVNPLKWRLNSGFYVNYWFGVGVKNPVQNGVTLAVSASSFSGNSSVVVNTDIYPANPNFFNLNLEPNWNCTLTFSVFNTSLLKSSSAFEN